MSFIQRLVCTIVPKRIADEIESESREWKLTCAGCSASRSVWEAGGIRWKAKGLPVTRTLCAGCGQVTRHDIARDLPRVN